MIFRIAHMKCPINFVCRLNRPRLQSRRFCQTATASHPKDIEHRCSFGQPAPSTHPHLMGKGQVTPGLFKEEYQERRFRLMESLALSMNKAKTTLNSHLVIVPSATKVFISDKIPYTFRQNTEFLYLCGFQEPDSLLVLYTTRGKNLPEHRSMLFVPKKNPQTEIWEGPRSGVNGALQLLGVDEASEIENMEQFLQSFVRENPQFMLWYDAFHPTSFPTHQVMKDFITHCGKSLNVESPRLFIQRLRLVKSESEIRLMRQSTEATSLAMKEVMRWSHPNVPEAHLNAKMEFECRIRGAERLAYPPVVAGGPRSHIIHYIANDQIIQDGQTVLMDAGAEFHGYTSDLTRTWPVSGRFVGVQRDLYEAVLQVQEELIAQCSGLPSLDHLFHVMCQLLGTKLQELGVLSSNLNKFELSKIAYSYCPHHVGHYLGMDVHDTTLISRNVKLKPGMVITIEPGVYIHENNHRVPPEFRGLNVRIEDDVLLTHGDPEVLTVLCPKTVSDIENLFTTRK